MEILTDGGFELGPGAGPWVESSTNFGTPICDLTSCGNGSGTGPRTGTYWAWFGGIAGAWEQGTVSQTLTIPVGTATLSFWLEMPSCESSNDWFQVFIDSNLIFYRDGADPACGAIGYVKHTLDVSAYADGYSHTLQFHGDTYSFTVATNFFVDDASLLSCQ